MMTDVRMNTTTFQEEMATDHESAEDQETGMIADEVEIVITECGETTHENEKVREGIR